ncbi:uncharacterized protein LOC118266989 isoform X2 [Spodoptera frugiperda]|uniref:Superoxide dismutase [Cu-Zn] n=1 Tax=Spodoptera frugiperda TaxID=7108 RepID=A0A9R0D181_SPOFR|nr:uncharacterized protein LOC118266989 isoform X2 [Spodoptera frugiperda]
MFMCIYVIFRYLKLVIDYFKMFKTLMFVAAAVVLASAHDDGAEIKQAIVKLDGSGVSGLVKFIKLDDGKVHVTGKVTGMPAGQYGFHIHETGDLSNGCLSTGGHFNPNGHDHGHPHDEIRHVGDLGNVEFDSTKTANIDFIDPQIKLNGRHNIIGRALVLHAGTDDYGRTDHPDSKKTGNAGGRVVCGIVGILSEEPLKANSAAVSTSSLLTAISVYSLIAIVLH